MGPFSAIVRADRYYYDFYSLHDSVRPVLPILIQTLRPLLIKCPSSFIPSRPTYTSQIISYHSLINWLPAIVLVLYVRGGAMSQHGARESSANAEALMQRTCLFEEVEAAFSPF
jgi:hypothetical protein